MWVQPHAWSSTIAALDYLEGYDPADPDRLFDRVVRSVTTDEGSVDCWVYLAGRMLAGSARPVVRGGDWVAYCADPPTAP